MSHFTEIRVAFSQQNEAELIAALELQFGKGSVDVHNEPVGLHGVAGDDRSKASVTSADYAPPCHLVIRQRHVGRSSNDIGYRRTEDGKYVAYISDWDRGANFNPAKQNRVLQEYTLRTSEKQCRNKGYTSFNRVRQDDGSIRLEAGGKFVK